MSILIRSLDIPSDCPRFCFRECYLERSLPRPLHRNNLRMSLHRSNFHRHNHHRRRIHPLPSFEKQRTSCYSWRCYQYLHLQSRSWQPHQPTLCALCLVVSQPEEFVYGCEAAPASPLEGWRAGGQLKDTTKVTNWSPQSFEDLRSVLLYQESLGHEADCFSFRFNLNYYYWQLRRLAVMDFSYSFMYRSEMQISCLAKCGGRYECAPSIEGSISLTFISELQPEAEQFKIDYLVQQLKYCCSHLQVSAGEEFFMNTFGLDFSFSLGLHSPNFLLKENGPI